MTSPLIAIGIAGGQGIFVSEHILPADFSTGIFSDSANTASRMLIFFTAFGSINFLLWVRGAYDTAYSRASDNI